MNRKLQPLVKPPVLLSRRPQSWRNKPDGAVTQGVDYRATDYPRRTARGCEQIANKSAKIAAGAPLRSRRSEHFGCMFVADVGATDAQGRAGRAIVGDKCPLTIEHPERGLHLRHAILRCVSAAVATFGD